MVMTCIKALTEVKMKVKDDVFRELTGMLSERKNLSLYESVPLDEGSYNLSESSYFLLRGCCFLFYKGSQFIKMLE